jgi:uncharacterized membrane protein YfcA
VSRRAQQLIIPMETSIFISSALILSAFTFSFAGFGFGLVAVPLLALVLPVKDAVAIQLPFSILMVVINSFRYGKSIKWYQLKPLFIGSVLAIPIGVYSLSLFPDMLMKRALAVFIVGVVLFDRMSQGEGTINQYAKTGQGGLVLGMISGWFIGAYTTGGPPAVIYATARFPEPKSAKGAMGLYFLATDILIVLLFIMTGLLTVELFYRAIRFTPAVLSGFLAGSLIFKNINRGTYLMGVHFLLMVSAFMLCVE